MSIQVKHDKGFCIPVALCDICGRVVKRAEDATVAWAPGEGSGPFNISTVHNGRCFDAFEKRDSYNTFDIPLPAFLIYLERELKLDREEAETQAEALSLV